MEKFIEKYYRIIVISALAFVLVVSVLNAHWDSAIFDETAHIPAGYSYLAEHDMRLNPEHPPLIKDLAGLPLQFMNLNFDTSQDFWSKDINGQWDAGRYFIFKAGNNADAIMFWSRIPIVLLSVLFGWFLFYWVRKLAGTMAALIALLLYAFDPNILGHNHYVTTDLGIAIFTVFSFYFFFLFIKDPSWKNVLLGGLFLGLIQLTKFSSILIFPIFVLVLLIYPLLKTNRHRVEPDHIYKLKKLGEYVGKGIIAFLISLVVVWVVYFINTYNMPGEKLEETINHYFSVSDVSSSSQMTNQVLNRLNDHVITRPLSEYGLGVAMVFKRVAGGNAAYFLGEVSNKAFPEYFPTVFFLKEPLTILFLMMTALGFVIFNSFRHILSAFSDSWKKAPGKLAHYFRTNIVFISMFLFVLLYSYISVTGNLNIGFRHLFPILPFIYILTAKSIHDLLRNTGDHKRHKFYLGTVMALLFFLILEVVLVYPNYMSYFNQVAGGPKNGYKFVTDSNADWGQDLKRLKKFLDQHPEIQSIKVDYFGGSDIRYYLGPKYIAWWDSKRPIAPGWYAISTNFLQGSIYDKTKKDSDSYRWLIGINPQYQIGTSILIYNISEEKAAQLKNQ